MSKAALKTIEAERPTKEQIAAWKKQHGNLYKISVEGYFAILRQPKLVDMEGASREAKKSPLSSVKYIVRNCALYIDDAINKDDSLFMSICTKAEEVVDIKESELEKL